MDTPKRPHSPRPLAVANVARAAVSASGVISGQKHLDDLSPAIHQAKEGILRILIGYAENIRAQIEVASPVSPLLIYYGHLADLILSIRNADEITLTSDENIRIHQVEIAPIETFQGLPQHQMLMLHAVSLYEFLKTPPFRMPGQNFGDLGDDMRGKTLSFDRKVFLGWLEKKRHFDEIMAQLGEMEFSKNGTFMPGYLHEVK